MDNFDPILRYTLLMLNGLALVVMALVGLVGGLILVSNYFMPHIHQFC
jgi:hypothetical protein